MRLEFGILRGYSRDSALLLSEARVRVLEYVSSLSLLCLTLPAKGPIFEEELILRTLTFSGCYWYWP
jgi:hypothetical protein